VAHGGLDLPAWEAPTFPANVAKEVAMRLKVSGMTCGHCVSAVSKAVRAIPAVQDVAVDLATGTVTVTGNPAAGAVREAIVGEGYEVLAG
jgi:copper chaperone